MGTAVADSHAGAATRLCAPAFVGRERELAKVTETLGRLPASVMIEGEAGIGKTRLLREVLASPAVERRPVLVAACPPVAEPFPLGPIVDALRGTRGGARNVVRGLALTPLAGALRPLFPEWAADLPPAPEPLDDVQATRHRLLSALAELLDQLGTELLVLEDAHWADASTLELLLMLTTRPGRPVSLVLTYRPEDVPEDSLLPRLTSRVPTNVAQCRIELAALSSEQCGAVVTSMLAAEEISPAFVAFLHAATDGVPLALEECVRLLRDRRDIVRKDGQWARVTMDELQVPATVRDSVLERVSRLEPGARRLLEAAAVVGESADESLLVEVAALGERDARQGLASALASRLLNETAPGQLVFRHVLTSRAVYEAIPASERRHLHHRAGRALEHADPRPVAQLARHFREARDLDAWSRYGEAAADLALESGDDRTAVSMLLDLLTEGGHPPGRHGHLARKLGEVATNGTSVLGTMGDRVREALHNAVSREDMPGSARGEVRFLLGRLLLQQHHLEAGYVEIELSVPDLGHSPALAARAMVLLSGAVIRGRAAAEAYVWLGRATPLMDRIESATERIALTCDRASALLTLGDEAGWHAAQELPTGSETVAARRELARGYENFGLAALEWGRYDQAARYLTAAMELIESLGYAREREIYRINHAHLDYCTGNWAAAAATARQLATSDEGHPLCQLESSVIQGLLALAAGDTATAENALRSVVAGSDNAALDDQVFRAAAALARLRLAQGAVNEAASMTQDAVDKIMATGFWLYASDIAPARVDALLAVGQVQQADELVAQFAAWLEGRDVPAGAAAVATCRASVAAAHSDPREAADLFADAARSWAALPRPYDELLALEHQGQCLLDAGEKDAAITVLSDAQKRLSELGARWDADRVAHLLREYGVEVRRIWRGGRRGYGNQLSPREREVARLVAEGMSNREVGEVLFLSPRTVDRHLSGALRKLGLHSRTALAKVVATGGLDTGDPSEPVT